jgi:hypothetical protein
MTDPTDKDSSGADRTGQAGQVRQLPSQRP